MSDEPKKRSRAWIKWVAIVLPLYVGGYIALGAHNNAPIDPRVSVRVFRSPVIAIAYLPLGWLEAKVFRQPVFIGTPSSEFSGIWSRFEP
jgi:hypothetical protein